MSSLPPTSALERPRPSRIAVLLLIIAVLATAWIGPIPHVTYRVPLALITAWGLWRRWRWAYLLTFINAAVWILIFLSIAVFLLVAPPWVLWAQWLYWLVPTGLVVAVCVLMASKAGQAEREKWMRVG